ncbi:3293_t:CDS:1 [Scutellospora calospora]|uniref:3293_t:CDS:1 n=1 Tax=Scutellospora calospora TaxID=85575 RepID=A0ACA9MR12_9GLOM|nr:3293_t:CDS:1 [Scutellospora calospora]
MAIEDLAHTLQAPAPQYVLGCLPIIATIGATPDNGCTRKILWLVRCLGCPFTGLFFHCNIMNDETAMCIYWLSSDYFWDENGNPSSYRPVGHHFMQPLLTSEQIERVNDCIAEASLVVRFSSIVSAYYIFVGIFEGMYRMIGPCSAHDWPYFPFSLTWTLPAIYKRIYGGKIVVNDPKRLLRGEKIYLKRYDGNKRVIDAQVIFTALFSIVFPWTTVFLAYLTRPVGFGCRSKYLTAVCSIWSFNSFFAYLYHRFNEEKRVDGNLKIHCWFCICGIIVAILLILLALLSHESSWWIILFGESCDISNECSAPDGEFLPISMNNSQN